MLTLKVLSSGSQGNCYLLQSGEETLILDCGIPIKEIKIGLNFDISNVVGVCVSHAHLDHSKSVADFEKMGIPVWQPYRKSKLIDHMKFGDFSVQCFPLPHNGCANFGFYIKVAEQKILYLTDYEYCRFNFKSLAVNHIFCECNYQKKLVEKGLPNYKHKVMGHSSLDYCKRFISDNATDALQTILLFHMGAETCNPIECVAEVQKVAGNGVYVDYARAGEEYQLRKGKGRKNDE
jgi:metallo-beta-lactamase domain protein